MQRKTESTGNHENTNYLVPNILILINVHVSIIICYNNCATENWKYWQSRKYKLSGSKYFDINTCINHIFVMQTVKFYTATCTKCLFANSKILLWVNKIKRLCTFTSSKGHQLQTNSKFLCNLFQHWIYLFDQCSIKCTYTLYILGFSTNEKNRKISWLLPQGRREKMTETSSKDIKETYFKTSVSLLVYKQILLR